VQPVALSASGSSGSQTSSPLQNNVSGHSELVAVFVQAPVAPLHTSCVQVMLSEHCVLDVQSSQVAGSPTT
jgi:hypothetical protein